VDGAGATGDYAPPCVRDYGDLVSMTADGSLLHLGIGSAIGAVTAPATPGGVLGGDRPGGSPGGDVVPGGVLGSGASSGSAEGGGGRLPFTGFAAAAVGSIGAGLAAAGVAIRRALRRRT
jgi:hypothetical protein